MARQHSKRRITSSTPPFHGGSGGGPWQGNRTACTAGLRPSVHKQTVKSHLGKKNPRCEHCQALLTEQNPCCQAMNCQCPTSPTMGAEDTRMAVAGAAPPAQRHHARHHVHDCTHRGTHTRARAHTHIRTHIRTRARTNTRAGRSSRS